jgi:GNAT superfamily N-acetyltransferase
VIDVRHEAPDSPASQALFAEYMELVAERAGQDLEGAEHIFATTNVFSGPGAAWLVMYDDEQPVACGGLRPLSPAVGEIKRMFVTAQSRRRGYGSRMLAALEGVGRAAGQARIRLLSTELLPEALELYRKNGYTIVSSHMEDDHRDYWLEKPL